MRRTIYGRLACHGKVNKVFSRFGNLLISPFWFANIVIIELNNIYNDPQRQQIIQKLFLLFCESLFQNGLLQNG